MRTASICQRVPRAVRKHAAYVVDTVALGCSDILSYGDNNGSWGGHTKSCRKYKIEVWEQLGITSMRRYHHSNDKGSPNPEGVYTLYRNYFQHAHTPEFRKVIATVNDWDGNMLPLAVVQYCFEGGIEVPIKLAKHGNDQRVDAEPENLSPCTKKKSKKNARPHHARKLWMNAMKKAEGVLAVHQWQIFHEIESRHTISICASVKVTLQNHMSSMMF